MSLQGIFIFIMFVGTGRVRRMLVERVLNRNGSRAVTSNSSTKSTRAAGNSNNGVLSNGHFAGHAAPAKAALTVEAVRVPPPSPSPRVAPSEVKNSVTFLTRDYEDDIRQDSGAVTPSHVQVNGVDAKSTDATRESFGSQRP